MTLYAPAAEPGQVIWEISVNEMISGGPAKAPLYADLRPSVWVWASLRVCLTALVTAAIGLLAAVPSFAATVIVDNADSGFAVLSGSAWTPATAPGQWLTDYVSQATGDPAGEVEWRPEIPTAGEYEVAVWIPATAAARPNNAAYTVHHAGGTSQVEIDQAAGEVRWLSLGTYNFAAGATGRVTLSNAAQAGTYIVADAARFSTGLQPEPEFRAFWASTSASHIGLQNVGQIDDMVARAMQGNYNVINALILYKQDTAGSLHGALWNSSILPKAPAYPPEIDPLAHLIARAHANGLKVHGRLIPYLVSQAWPPVGNTILTANPQWLCVRSADMGDGPTMIEGFYHLDPGSPEVQEYLISIVRELVLNYEIDGIHWDYIRHSGYDAGYPADTTYAHSSLARFRALTGRSDVPVPGSDAEWDNFRRRTIDELVRRSRAEIAAVTSNPAQPISLTAAVVEWGTPTTIFKNTYGYRNVFQDWEKWMRLGWLDGACPMNYQAEHIPSQSDLYRAWVDVSMGWRHQRHMYIGQCLYLNAMPNSIIQMLYAFDQGADGTINFAYSKTADNNLDGSFEADWTWYPYIAQNLYVDRAPVPAMPWRTASAGEGTLWGRITDGITGHPVENATVAVTGQSPVQTDGNGYFVATLIPADAAGTGYSVTAEHPGYLAVDEQASVLAGDVVRLDMVFNSPLPPVITEVPPGPDVMPVGTEHIRQLTLDQGTARPWMLVEGPSGASVSARGLVSGWVASQAEAGQLIDFTVRAENSAGSDEASWQIQVGGLVPCDPVMLTDFEGYANDVRVMFQDPRFSGSTPQNLELEPNVAGVTDQVAPFGGSACYKVQWQFVDPDPSRWMRLTTYMGAYIPNPTVDLIRPIRVRLRVDAGRFRLALGVRETGTTAPIGTDGGSTGTIEWVGAAGDINGAPQGVLVEPMPGVWQTFLFDPLTDPIHGMTGDGVLSSITNKGTLEHLAFAAVDTAGPFTVYIDEIDLRCDVPTSAFIVLESRDVDGVQTPPPAYAEIGTWTNSTIKSAAPELAGTGSRFTTYEVPNAGTDNATFVPTIAAPGRYEVFVTWADGANCYDARYTVRHCHGDTVLLVDQIASGAPEPANYDQWISLGQYWFAAGQSVTNASINVSEETVSGRPSPSWGYRVYADGLKLVFVDSWPNGDYTREGRIDLGDFAYWSDCMTGPAVGYVAAQCHAFDFDVDDDTDLADFAEFQQRIPGPER